MRELLKADKIYFVLSMFLSGLFGFLFKKYAKVSSETIRKRHILSLSGGVFLILLCFGSQILHLVIPMVFVYSSMKFMSSSFAFYISCAFCYFYLTFCHLWRMYYDYGGYELDITGPLMVLVQRLTMTCASYDDGCKIKSFLKKKESMSEKQSSSESSEIRKIPNVSTINVKFSQLQMKYALNEIPTVLEFSSYCINFQTVIIGPLMCMKDYLIFIEGREEEHLKTDEEKEYFEKNKEELLEAKDEIVAYAKQVAIFGILYILISGYFPPSFYLSDEFATYSFTKRLMYLWTTANFFRQQYYFGWTVTSICCLLSGLGFSGLDHNLQPQYKLISNFNFKGVEFAGSVKELIDNWNTPTLHWLRLVVFERCPSQWSTLMVFVTSCVWHGYYPGYYMFFISMAWFSQLGRLFRKRMRPILFHRFANSQPPEHPFGQNWLDRSTIFSLGMNPQPADFRDNAEAKRASNHTPETVQPPMPVVYSQRYDFLTFIATYTVVNYSALAFILLGLTPSFEAWGRFLYVPHLVGVLLHLFITQHGRFIQLHSEH